jgi:hypothetical protein
VLKDTVVRFDCADGNAHFCLIMRMAGSFAEIILSLELSTETTTTNNETSDFCMLNDQGVICCCYSRREALIVQTIKIFSTDCPSLL